MIFPVLLQPLESMTAAQEDAPLTQQLLARMPDHCQTSKPMDDLRRRLVCICTGFVCYKIWLYTDTYTVSYDVCSHMNCDSWFKQINVRYVWCWIHFFSSHGGRDWWHVAVVGSSPGGMPWQARASLRSGRETQMVSQWVEGKISPGNMMKHCETLWNIINTVPTINGELWCVFFLVNRKLRFYMPQDGLFLQDFLPQRKTIAGKLDEPKG